MKKTIELDYSKRKSLGLQGLFSIIKIELMAFKNNLQLLLNSLLAPVLSFIFLSLSLNKLVGDVDINGVTMTYINYTFIGIIARQTFDQMYTTVYRVIIDRKYHLLSYKYYMGVDPFYYVVGMSSMPILTFLLQAICLYIIGIIIGATVSIKSFVLILLFAFICQIFWCELGILIALATKNYKTRDIIMNVLLIPLAYATPIFYVLDKAPKAIKYISLLNPLTYQMSVMRSIEIGRIDTNSFIISVLLTAILVFIVSFTLKRIEFKSVERR